MRSSRLSGSTSPHTTNGPFTFIDLFSGCGGFSLGLERAGFRALAAIDINSHAVETYRKNFPDVAYVLNQDLTTFDPSELDIFLKGERVDLIVGGPPCQGFSNVRNSHDSAAKDVVGLAISCPPSENAQQVIGQYIVGTVGWRPL